MSNNYDDYSYDDSKNKSGLAKKLLIVTLVIIAILVVIYLLKSCGNEKVPTNNEPKPVAFDYEKTLLDAGKSYYENNEDEYPQAIGECTQVTLQVLIEKGLINPNEFGSCNLTNTYLRVCMLSNGNKQYTPWLSCSNKNSENEYGNSAEGTLNDVVANSTYVEFKFLPEVLATKDANLGKVEELWKSDITYPSYKTISTTNHYRYRDKLFTWDVTTKKYYTSQGEKTAASDVNEYYTVSPNSNYNEYDSKTTEAYKWYTTTAQKVYALGTNGAKASSPTAIGEYTHNEGGIKVAMYRTRTITSTTTPNKYYACSTDADSKYIIYQPAECGKGTMTNYTYQREIIYSCADPLSNSDSVIAKKVNSASDACNVYSDWTKPTQTVCDTKNENICQKLEVTFYNWYKLEDSGTRTYYPSGASTAAGETIYYTSAPKEGAIKDTVTKSTAYKWFKSSTKTTTEYTAVAPSGYASAKKTSNYKWTDWSGWSTKNPKINDGRTRSIETKTKIKLQQILGTDTNTENWTNLANNINYLTEEEMIKLFNDNKYKVSSLLDITNNGEIRYQVKMYLRNKKEAK